MPEMQGFIAEVVDGIRAHYASGHFDRAEALARIKAAASLTDQGAVDLLDAEESATLRYERSTKPRQVS